MSTSRQPGQPGSASHLRWLLIPFSLLAYAIFSFVCMAWLGHQAPLSVEQAAEITVFGQGRPMSQNLIFAMGLILLMFGIPLAMQKKTVIGMTLCWMFGLALVSATGTQFTNNILKRIAVLDGNARVGCFVEDSRECYEHLGMLDDFPDARSEGRPGKLAPWAKAKLKGGPDNLVSYYIPGFLLIKAPFYVSRGSELNEKLATQRKESEHYRAELATRVAKAPRYAVELTSAIDFVPSHPRTVPVRFKVEQVPIVGTPEGVNAQAREMLSTLKNCEASGDAFADVGYGRVFVSMKSLECDSARPGEAKKVTGLVGYLRDPRKLNPTEIFRSAGTPGVFGEAASQENPPREGLKLAAGTKATLILE